jgi:hypothetical protein
MDFAGDLQKVSETTEFNIQNGALTAWFQEPLCLPSIEMAKSKWNKLIEIKSNQFQMSKRAVL